MGHLHTSGQTNPLAVAFSICDKCGGYVPPHNDVRQFEVELGKLHKTDVWRTHARHLMPVISDKEPFCEGSPSRFRHLPPIKTEGSPAGYLEAYERVLRK